MKQYTLRSDIETINICECGHPTYDHDYRFRDWILNRDDNTGRCDTCTCPKYKKEKSMNKKEYIDNKNAQEKLS